MIATAENIRNVRPIADNIDDTKRIEPYIREAETLDVLPALGAGLYKQFSEGVTNNEITTDSGNVITLTDEDFMRILEGCYFDRDRQHSEGLYSAIAYLAYSRFMKNNQLNVTAFGVVFKQGEFSEKADEKTIVRMSNEAHSIGMEYLSQVVNYLKFSNIICYKKNVKLIKFKAIGL
ncbi:MAG: hypothetical protein LBS50_11275 [Prevotellaceae bacterium]|jgi:hypothetical protein|nr:hypothetical protein [Prevotellaceae bacterium]